jgi:hypothetical protein
MPDTSLVAGEILRAEITEKIHLSTKKWRTGSKVQRMFKTQIQQIDLRNVTNRCTIQFGIAIPVV